MRACGICGSGLHAVRGSDAMHTEGKSYVVQDGDVLHILFNV
jgi:ribosome-binding ATPase YchF (GTP1/OBG family)